MPDPVGKCPPLSEEVLDRAVEAGARAERAHGVKVCEDFHPHLPNWDDDNLSEPLRENYRREARRILGAAAPVIAEAGYRAGIEDARKKIQVAAERYDSQRDRANWQDPFRKGKTAGFVAALAALTDTEGRDE